MTRKWVWSVGGKKLTGGSRSTGRKKKPVPVPICPPQIRQWLAWYRMAEERVVQLWLGKASRRCIWTCRYAIYCKTQFTSCQHNNNINYNSISINTQLICYMFRLFFEPSSGIHFKNYCFSVLSYSFWAIALGIPFVGTVAQAFLNSRNAGDEWPFHAATALSPVTDTQARNS